MNFLFKQRPVGLAPLFFISMAATGFETALTRYFALSKYSEYGYWVISIVMAGLALSGVVLALWREHLARHGQLLLRTLPMLMVAAGGLGYRFVTLNPFNPLQLQNSVTWQSQIGNIGLYYLALLPFFFLVGLFISLSFILNENRIGKVYAADLLGAGAGSALVLVLCYWLTPFKLMPAMLVPLGIGCLVIGDMRFVFFSVLVFGQAENMLVNDDRASISETKPIYAPLHTQNARTMAEIKSPRGLYDLLDDFTERADVDVSNDAGQLNIPGPPRSFGLYRDGMRIASVPRDAALTADYAPALLSALPYLLNSHADVLLIGSGGGFRMREAASLGAATVEVSEPDPVLGQLYYNGLGGAPAQPRSPDELVYSRGPLAIMRDMRAYDVIDISSDFLDQAEANQAAFSAEALHADYRHLTPNGLLSIPVSIRDFPAYALRVLTTLKQAIPDAAEHVAVYRSAWNVRILVSRTGWTATRIAALRKFADDRSFDVVYYPGFDHVAARENIYNDLPPVSFATGEVDNSVSPTDALANETAALMADKTPDSAADFDLRPITLDRPAYYSLLRLTHLSTLLKRLEVLPQNEIAGLVNVAVLFQAAIFALLVLAVPLLARPRAMAEPGSLLRKVASFAALGLGFLFIEIYLIDRVSLYLADRTTGFALVLTVMLLGSGVGSLLAERTSKHGFAWASLAVALWCVIAAFAAPSVITMTQDWPGMTRYGLILLVIAPVSVVLGMPFPLLLSRSGVAGSWFLPWGWALNGALSVLATPLANLLALHSGFRMVLLCAALLYGICCLADPTSLRLRGKTTT